jgi:hypothetical protein
MYTGAFKHEQHLDLAEAKLSCDSCHVADASAKFALVRPGSADHAPCDACHKKAFYEAPGELCAVCHVRVSALELGQSPLRPYPGRHEAAQLVSEFNHQLHLGGPRPLSAEQVRLGAPDAAPPNPSGSKAKLPGQERCKACHRVASPEEAYASFPTHADCAVCHAEPGHGGRVAKPTMPECKACHAKDGPGEARHFIKNDLRFTHGKHQVDPGGVAIDCERCHYAVHESTSILLLILPRMVDCAPCHQDSAKTSVAARITNCGLCHQSDVNSKPLPGNHTL